MFDRFLDGFLTGVSYLFGFGIIAVLAVLTGAPVALAFLTWNAWWLLSYLLIIPIDFGIWNVFF